MPALGLVAVSPAGDATVDRGDPAVTAELVLGGCGLDAAVLEPSGDPGNLEPRAQETLHIHRCHRLHSTGGRWG